MDMLSAPVRRTTNRSAFAARLAITVCVACCADVVLAANGRSMPEPPHAMPVADRATLYLELVVNHVPSGRVVPVDYRNGRYYVPTAELVASGVRVPDTAGPQIAADAIDRVSAVYDENAQQLQFDVPADWLPTRVYGTEAVYEHQRAVSSLGALFNYDALATDSPHGGGSYVAAWLEQRVFDGFGFVSNTGSYRRYWKGGGYDPLGNRYVRYDTVWRYDDEDRLLSYGAGDLVTGALAWTSAVRLGGVQIARNFGLRPDLVTWPLPQYSGEAAVPSAVDLFINGFKASTTDVQPGPYTINNVPFINGAGQATVVTTDALGRQTTVSVPFYVTSTMLKPGLADFSLSVGALRRQYGIASADYGRPAASGSLRYGVSDGFTLETHAEGAGPFRQLGIGANLAPGRWGTLNVASALSRHRADSGHQHSVGYTYYSGLFGVAAQHVARSRRYMDLARYATLDGRARRDDATILDAAQIRHSSQLTGSLTFGRQGSIGAGYFDVSRYDGGRVRLVNLSYTRPLWRGASLYASANRSLGDAGYAAQVQVMLPLGRTSGNVTADATRDRGGRYTERVTYSRAGPTEGGFDWNLAYAGGASRYRQADLGWRGQHFQTQGGVYGESGRYTRWGELSGSLVMMDRALFAANRVSDAFVLVSTDGHAGVPVYYENQMRGVTDGGGHLMVPSVASWYRGRFAIDPLELPASVQTPKVEDYLTVRQNSGALLRFPVQRIVAANVRLVDGEGRPLPKGSIVKQLDNGQQGFVGWDGVVYLEELGAHNRIEAALPDGRACTAAFDMDPRTDDVARIGPLDCR
ncbi:outer membrane usher protein [Paraburkholderia caballeronis]|nr:outer membrane usher protein [Paraburkholderia caballeronis]TDV18939.1 outer membrane usher protein [Paraburkholderia caballeronis]TDV27072.1 outer membrane usher protein [Paraburkholderia caballeronis]